MELDLNYVYFSTVEGDGHYNTINAAQNLEFSPSPAYPAFSPISVRQRSTIYSKLDLSRGSESSAFWFLPHAGEDLPYYGSRRILFSTTERPMITASVFIYPITVDALKSSLLIE